MKPPSRTDQDFQVATLDFPCYETDTDIILENLADIRSGQAAGISYGFIFDPDETFTRSTDSISAVALTPGGISSHPVMSLEPEGRMPAAMAMAALIADETLHELILDTLPILAGRGLHDLLLEGPVDAICLPGGVVVEAFDDYWPARGRRDISSLVARRFLAIGNVRSSNHARLRFRRQAEAYIEERVLALTVATPACAGPDLGHEPRDTVALASRT